jgi:hypothetical protein
MNERPTSSADDRIDAVLRAEPPVDGAILEGWVTFSEWRKPGGETVLLLLGKPEDSLTQLKGYVHSGLLNMVWGSTGVRSAQ